MSKHTNGIVAALLAATASAQTTVRVNLGPGDVQATGNSAYTGTADNGTVAFTSDATNLVAGDTNGVRDVFVRTPQGSTLRVSVSSAGIQGNGTSGTNHYNGSISISPTGRYVAFDSEATNLVASDTNAVADVFLRDVQTNTTVRVSVATGGGQANALSRVTSQAISSDGRYVVFASTASNLVPGVNGAQNLFVRDLVASQTTCVTLGVGGTLSNGNSERASITPDGRYVVFQSDASNLVASDLNLNRDVFLHDRQTGTTEQVNPLSFLSSGAGSVSADGRFVAFGTGNALVPGDTNGQPDIYVRDRTLGTVERVSVSTGGGQSSGGIFGCQDPWISASGTVVAFTSDFTTLVTPDTNGTNDVFVRNRSLGTTQRVTQSTAGVQGAGFNTNATMSPSSLYAAFVSSSTNLVTGDTNGVDDVFLRTLLNDECSTPRSIAGTGTFAYDTTSATTGVEGQSDSGCGAGIYRDVWFSWTATFTGQAILNTAWGGTFATKAAVYVGDSCPTGVAYACDDNGFGEYAVVCFPVTTGSVYLIQLGSEYMNHAGAATFEMWSYLGGGYAACEPIDSGFSSASYGGGEGIGWLQRFGEIGGNSTVTAISAVWGSPSTPALDNPQDGSPARIAIWDDPDDDGLPDDAVLLQIVNVAISGSGTDAFQTITLNPPVSVSGYYFVGAGVDQPGHFRPMPVDHLATCAGWERAFYFSNGSSPSLNFANLAANVYPPLGLEDFGLVGQLLLRPTCGGAIVFCVPGQAGVIPCPCSNPGLPGRGCQNSSSTGGAVLSSAGNATLAADTVVFTTTGEKPSALSIVLQGSTNILAGAVYGQGVRCLGGNLKRLYTKTAVGGSITAPAAGDPSVSSRSATLGDPLTPGTTRYYQVYYRDPVVQGGCPANATFNMTQGQIVTWM